MKHCPMKLRAFRDRWLLPHAPGRALVGAYYRYSPPLAAYVRAHPLARTAARALLTPVVVVVDQPGWLLVPALALAALAWRRRRRPACYHGD